MNGLLIYLNLSDNFYYKKYIINDKYLKIKTKELIKIGSFKNYKIYYYDFQNYKISIKNIGNFIIILIFTNDIEERHFIKCYKNIQKLWESKHKNFKFLEKSTFISLYNFELNSILKYFNNIKLNDPLEIALNKGDLLVKKAENQKNNLLENSNKINLLTDYGEDFKEKALIFSKNTKKLERTIYYTKTKVIASISLLSVGFFGILYLF